MLGIDYNSDSDSDNGLQQPVSSKPSPSIAQLSKSSNSSLSLPPPKAASTNANANGKKPAAPKPKKIVVTLPKIEGSNSGSEDENERPAAKKPRLGGGGGSSSLLSMLPAPKKNGLALPPPQRVLGGGKPGSGLSFSEAPSTSKLRAVRDGESRNEDNEVEARPSAPATATSMIPPSLLRSKNKAKPSLPSTSQAVHAEDFFGLGSSSKSAPATPEPPPDPSPSSSSLITAVSAAPTIEEFRPPSPKVDDPYPGYYQLPSGSWAMHEPAYYETYTKRWAAEYDAQIRAYERSQKGFEGAEENAEDVNASELADAARAAREEKKALTQRAGREIDKPVPKVALNPTKMGGVARSRHQLHSLLADAFMNREALEDKIAQGKRNRKEAGNKYGF